MRQKTTHSIAANGSKNPPYRQLEIFNLEVSESFLSRARALSFLDNIEITADKTDFDPLSNSRQIKSRVQAGLEARVALESVRARFLKAGENEREILRIELVEAYKAVLEL